MKKKEKQTEKEKEQQEENGRKKRSFRGGLLLGEQRSELDKNVGSRREFHLAGCAVITHAGTFGNKIPACDAAACCRFFCSTTP